MTSVCTDALHSCWGLGVFHDISAQMHCTALLLGKRMTLWVRPSVHGVPLPNTHNALCLVPGPTAMPEQHGRLPAVQTAL